MMFNTTYETLPLMGPNGSHRHPRFGFLPIVGLLLANLFSNSIAKFAPPGSIRLSYDPVTWSNPSSHETYWNGVTNPYGPPSPDESTEPQYIHHHHHVVQPPNQQQIVNIIEGEPAEVDSTPQVVLEERSSVEKPAAEERSFAGVFPIALNYTGIDARAIVKRGAMNKYVKVRNNNKYYNQKRRRTTTPDYYYDSYEDSSTRKSNSRRRTRPTRRPVSSYEDLESNSYSDNYSDYYEYPSYELTTRSKRRRTTTTATTERPRRIKNKNKNKNRKRQKVVSLEEYNDEEEYDDYEPVEQTSIAQRQQTTRQTTTPTTTTTTTASPTTVTIQTEITSGVTSTTSEENTTTATPMNSTGYGYGPSNGNENISLTYGPPTQGEDIHGPYGSLPQSLYGSPSQSYGPIKPASPAYSAPVDGYYQVPFSDWYSGEINRNSIVKKIHDIVGFENILQKK